MSIQKIPRPVLFLLGVAAVALVAYGIYAWQIRNASQSAYTKIDGGLYANPVNVNGKWYLVPPDEVYESGVTSTDVPALTNPNTASVDAMDSKLVDSLYGIDVNVKGEHRFYPYQILGWHILANDVVGGENILVAYDPLTSAAAVYKRGDATYSITGTVYNNGELMTQGDGTDWLVASGAAVVATDEGRVGSILEQYPSTTMKWGDWKKLYPNGKVLSTDTGYERDYTRHPYNAYPKNPGVFFPLNHTDASVQMKVIVTTYNAGLEGAVIIPRITLQARGVENVSVGNTHIVAFYDKELDTTRVFLLTEAENARTFTYNTKTDTFVDDGTHSVWNARGECVSGTLRGTTLPQAPAVESYFFSAASLYPNAHIVGVENDTGADTKS